MNFVTREVLFLKFEKLPLCLACPPRFWRGGLWDRENAVIDVRHILIACELSDGNEVKMRGADRVRGKWEMRGGMWR